MTTRDTSQQTKTHLIRILSEIATSTTSGIDGSSRIKAAVMAAYLSGLSEPVDPDIMVGLFQIEREFGIELRTRGS